MTDAISIISSAIKTVQKLREVAQKRKDADTNTLIADLMLSLSDLKMQFADLQEENLNLKAEIKKIGEQSELRSKLILKNLLYYFKEDEPDRADGPYCTRCFDVESKLVLVTPLFGDFKAFGKFVCHNCKAHY